jgi:hypothetical protein
VVVHVGFYDLDSDIDIDINSDITSDCAHHLRRVHGLAVAVQPLIP